MNAVADMNREVLEKQIQDLTEKLEEAKDCIDYFVSFIKVGQNSIDEADYSVLIDAWKILNAGHEHEKSTNLPR